MKESKAITIPNVHQETLDWDEIYQSMLPRVFNYFLYRTGDLNIAQDLAGTTFERAWSKKGALPLRPGIGTDLDVWHRPQCFQGVFAGKPEKTLQLGAF